VVKDIADLNTNVAGYNTTRPGAIKPEIRNIIFHDTANTGMVYNGDALAHAQLLKSGWSASWHYTVDSRIIYQSIPDNEVAWHGGNSYANLYSIGIETCVNYGVIKGDIYQTWQRMGKLASYLLDKHSLPVTAVVSHAEIGRIAQNLGVAVSYIKCCPMTIRHAGLWDTARDMIGYELLYLLKVAKEGYTTEIIIDPDSTQYIDAGGRIKEMPTVQTTVSYTIKLTAPDKTFAEKRYSSVLRPENTSFLTKCDISNCTANNITSIP